MKFIRFSGEQRLCDLILATWRADPGQVSQALPAGFKPLTEAGQALVSIVGFRARDVRVGRLPAPAYSGVNVRTYVRDREGDPAIFILQSRVTPSGMGALALGLPVRATVITARQGTLQAAGMGVSIHYEPTDAPVELPAVEPSISELDVAYWKAAGIRRLQTRHAEVEWQSATPTEPLRLDPVLALGFDVQQPDWLHYASELTFELALPPRKISRR